MKNFRCLVVFLTIILLANTAHCAVFSFEAEPDTGAAVFPTGTMFRVVIQQTISSKENKTGDPVSFRLVSDVTVGKSVCIPEGSVFLGEVIDISPAKEGRDGFFRIHIDELVLTDGWRTGLSARILDNRATDLVGGGITKRTEYRKIPHSIDGLGTVVQLVRTGPRAFGENRALPAEHELIIVLESDLEVKYLEKLEKK